MKEKNHAQLGLLYYPSLVPFVRINANIFAKLVFWYVIVCSHIADENSPFVKTWLGCRNSASPTD